MRPLRCGSDVPSHPASGARKGRRACVPHAALGGMAQRAAEHCRESSASAASAPATANCAPARCRSAAAAELPSTHPLLRCRHAEAALAPLVHARPSCAQRAADVRASAESAVLPAAACRVLALRRAHAIAVRMRVRPHAQPALVRGPAACCTSVGPPCTQHRCASGLAARKDPCVMRRHGMPRGRRASSSSISEMESAQAYFRRLREGKRGGFAAAARSGGSPRSIRQFHPHARHTSAAS
jgi:hypothetical protein